jgi:hypothetical protein
MKIGYANILQAFDPECVGSKVTNREFFLASVKQAVEAFDFDAQRTPGQGYLPLSPNAVNYVSAGVGRHVSEPESYVLRSWRGSVHAYLKRNLAAKVDSVAVVVYTAWAYLHDPDVAEDLEETRRIMLSDITHVIVAVLASAGPESPLSPGRLVSNLAGGNKDALTWTADEIRAKAVESSAYASEWGVVAD